jgi:hypothetical protein
LRKAVEGKRIFGFYTIELLTVLIGEGSESQKRSTELYCVFYYPILRFKNKRLFSFYADCILPVAYCQLPIDTKKALSLKKASWPTVPAPLILSDQYERKYFNKFELWLI